MILYISIAAKYNLRVSVRSQTKDRLRGVIRSHILTPYMGYLQIICKFQAYFGHNTEIEFFNF